MQTINKVLIGTIVTGGVAAALVGTGAGATFTDAVHANQSITAGTLNLTVTGPGPTSADGKTVTLDPLGPESSTFTSGNQQVVIANVGTVKATAFQLTAADPTSDAAGAALAQELYVTVKFGATQLYDGPLSGLVSAPVGVTGNINPGETRSLGVTFYAGSGSAPSLDNAAEGGVVTPSLTVSFTG